VAISPIKLHWLLWNSSGVSIIFSNLVYITEISFLNYMSSLFHCVISHDYFLFHFTIMFKKHISTIHSKVNHVYSCFYEIPPPLKLV